MKKSIKTVPKHNGSRKWLEVHYDGELAGYLENSDDGVLRFEALKDCRYGHASLIKIGNLIKRLRRKNSENPVTK